MLTDHIREVEEWWVGEAHNEAGVMLGKVEAKSVNLPQNAEGDVFSDERDGNAWHKSNQIGG